MGWFTSGKRGHVVRNEHGTMVAKIHSSMLEATLDQYGDKFKLNPSGSKYVYSGEGFSVGSPEYMKTFLWYGYTIDCASVTM